MFQFPGCPPMTLFDSDHGDGALPPPGFPIRISMDQTPACGSPWLNAACHVLLRQSVPWHSPCALICLIFCVLSARSLPRLLPPRIAPWVPRPVPLSSPEPLRSRSAYVCRHVCTPYSCSLAPIPNINSSSRRFFSRGAASASAQRSAATPRSASLHRIENPSTLWMNEYLPLAILSLCFSLCSFQDAHDQFGRGGLKWTRTTDLTLIRRVL